MHQGQGGQQKAQAPQLEAGVEVGVQASVVLVHAHLSQPTLSNQRSAATAFTFTVETAVLLRHDLSALPVVVGLRRMRRQKKGRIENVKNERDETDNRPQLHPDPTTPHQLLNQNQLLLQLLRQLQQKLGASPASAPNAIA